MRTIAVGKVQLDRIDTQTNAALRGRNKIVPYLLQTGVIERACGTFDPVS